MASVTTGSAPSATTRRSRLARPIATGSLLVILGLAGAELAMILRTIDQPPPDQWGFRGSEAVLALAFGSIWALIVARRPENRLGWLGLALSLLLGVQAVVDQYPVFAATFAPPLPAAGVVNWLRAWIWAPPSILFVGLLPLFYPQGRLLSPRWRFAAGLALVATAVQVGTIVLASQPLGPVPPTTSNVAYVEAVGPRAVAGLVLMGVAAALSAASLGLRFRRAGIEERQQLKWLGYAMVLVVIGVAVGTGPIFLGQLFFIGATLFAAGAVAMAILRYRLYEIDAIINRTLVYGAMSALLAGVYTASITLSQRLFLSVTGERSDAAVVMTTLVVVSLFTPLKSRVQAAVDHRYKSDASPAAPPPPAADHGADPLRLLGQLGELHAAGYLTDREFRANKAELLRRL